MLLLCVQITEPYLIICLRNPCSQKPGDRSSRGNSGNSNKALPATRLSFSRGTPSKKRSMSEEPGWYEPVASDPNKTTRRAPRLRRKAATFLRPLMPKGTLALFCRQEVKCGKITARAFSEN